MLAERTARLIFFYRLHFKNFGHGSSIKSKTMRIKKMEIMKANT